MVNNIIVNVNKKEYASCQSKRSQSSLPWVWAIFPFFSGPNVGARLDAVSASVSFWRWKSTTTE